MRVFLKNASFHGIVVEHILRSGNRQWPEVWRLVNDGMKSGIVKPLPVIVYDMRDHEAAFRKMGEGTHIGKILLKVNIKNHVTKKVVFERGKLVSREENFAVINLLGADLLIPGGRSL